MVFTLVSVIYAFCGKRISGKANDKLSMSVMLEMSFIEIFCIGMLGEYMVQILRKLTKKPFVIEKERINFDD